MIVTNGRFAGVTYEVTGDDVSGDVTQVTYDNPTDSDRIIKISAGDMNWSYTMVRQSNGVVAVDPGIPGESCSVALC